MHLGPLFTSPGIPTPCNSPTATPPPVLAGMAPVVNGQALTDLLFLSAMLLKFSFCLCSVLSPHPSSTGKQAILTKTCLSLLFPLSNQRNPQILSLVGSLFWPTWKLEGKMVAFPAPPKQNTAAAPRSVTLSLQASEAFALWEHCGYTGDRGNSKWKSPCTGKGFPAQSTLICTSV